MSRLKRAWAAAERILVVRLDALGDVLMTTPAFRALAQSGPDVRLTLLTSAAGAAVAPLLPEIDDVIVHAPPWMKVDDGSHDAAADRDLIERLRSERFDGAVIFTVHSQSALPAALLCHLADIPLRLAHARENPYRLLTDWVPDPEGDEPLRHETQRQLDLVARIGATIADPHLSVRVPASSARAIRARLAGLALRGDVPWAVLAPGASTPSRRYAPDRYRDVARSLARDHGWRIVVTGTRSERAVGDAIVEGLGECGTNLAGVLTLPDLAALVAAAPVVIANNSGTAHLAAAVGTPVVDVYALTNLQHAPWAVPSRVITYDVPCKGCRKSICPFGHNACLAGVPPDEVVAAALDLLRRPTARPAMPAGILAPAIAAGTVAPTAARPPG